jgi:hypothetical protein
MSMTMTSCCWSSINKNDAPDPDSGGVQVTRSGKRLAVSASGLSRDLVYATTDAALS